MMNISIRPSQVWPVLSLGRLRSSLDLSTAATSLYNISLISPWTDTNHLNVRRQVSGQTLGELRYASFGHAIGELVTASLVISYARYIHYRSFCLSQVRSGRNA